ncbi:IS1 family transposase [Candidatus Neptunichlamydia sp. REUL1]|uniref:IS1 family transposase n=1 Tax=Candidatus Neptunichlamydia sp. REUL1 TaxID=3064277 RepID=UPI002931A38C|nr:IS1 family transposase [Candidatus Neptunochlamydia sp. REUL1]
MRCGISLVQKNKLWIIKALDRASKKTVAWVLGHRSTATFRKLYSKVCHLTECIFFTDDWPDFAKVLPKDRRIIGKSGTIAIKQDNSNTRHHIGRMVSKTKEMVDTTIKLWCALSDPEIFASFQKLRVSIFR